MKARGREKGRKRDVDGNAKMSEEKVQKQRRAMCEIRERERGRKYKDGLFR